MIIKSGNLTTLALAATVILASSTDVFAQQVYLPTPVATPVVSYYRPNPVLRPWTYAANVNYVAPVTLPAPVVPLARPVTANYTAPAPVAVPTTTAYYVSPVTSYYVPTTSYYAPTPLYVTPPASTPVTSFYAAPTFRAW